MSLSRAATLPGLDEFEAVRVVDKTTVLKLVNLSSRTWEKMQARGETPPITRISERRAGYRLIDLRAWLDARRVSRSTMAERP